MADPVKLYNQNPLAPQFFGGAPEPTRENPLSALARALSNPSPPPVNALWGSLPPQARQSYSSLANALAELSPGATVRDSVDAYKSTVNNAMAGNTWGALGSGANLLTAMAGVVPVGKAFSSRATADQLEKVLKRHGVELERSASNLSDSQYLKANYYNPTKDEWGTPVKVRLSSHEAKPTYETLNGSADFEIGTHALSHTDNAYEAASRILARFGITPDSSVLSGAQKRAAIRETDEATQRRIEAETLKRQTDMAAETSRIDAILEQRGYNRATMSGKDWRELRYNFRKNEAAH